MPHHYTKNTVMDTFWCTKCGKPTQHRVLGGRRGPCLVCMEKLELEAGKPKDKPAVQLGMFGGKGEA